MRTFTGLVCAFAARGRGAARARVPVAGALVEFPDAARPRPPRASLAPQV